MEQDIVKLILDFIDEHKKRPSYKYLKELGFTKYKIEKAFMIINNLKVYGTAPQKLSKKEEDISVVLKEFGLNKDTLVELLRPKNTEIHTLNVGTTRRFKIGVVSDTHLCDKSCAIDQLHDIYKEFEKENVDAVLHAGDIVAGMNVYRGQFNDLIVHGFAGQLDYAVQNYPKIEGIKTYAISGNHDLSFKVNAGANFLESFAERRPDIVNCGEYDGTVMIRGIKIGLHHGGGGSAYAQSYKLQKAIESLGGGNKPQIYILGHYHALLEMSIRNVSCYMGGCFQFPNDFSVRYNLPNSVGGYVLDVEVCDDKKNTIRSITNRRIMYYYNENNI